MAAKVKNVPVMEFAGPGDKTEQYELWKQRMGYFALTSEKTGEALVPYMLQAIDDEGLKIFNSFHLTVAQKKDPNEIYAKFEERLKITEPNFRAARLDLHFQYQEKGDTLDKFYTRFRGISVKCNFTADEEKERFIEQLLASTPMPDYRKWLIDQKPDIKIEAVLAEGRAQETTENTLTHIDGRGRNTASVAPIDAIRQNSREQQYGRKQQGQGHRSTGKKCHTCGKMHEGECYFKDAECYKCGTIGHLSRACPNKKEQSSSKDKDKGAKKPQGRGNHGGRRQKHVNQISTNDDDDSSQYDYQNDDFETVVYSTLEVDVAGVTEGRSRKEVYANIDIQLPNIKSDRKRRLLKMKVDTGAMGNTIPLRIFRHMMPEKIGKDGKPIKKEVIAAKNTTLVAYNNTKIECFGSINIPSKYGEVGWAEHKFYIVDVPGPAVCGLPMAEALGLVTVHCSIEETPLKGVQSVKDLQRRFPDQFDRIGNLPGKAKIFLKDGAIPYIDPPRKYSIHMKPKLKAELDQMESQGVISRITGHSDWCSSMVTSIKENGSVRVCLDPKKLNMALRRCPHKILTIEEISHQFHGAKYFSKLDAKAGYWSVELEEDSQILTTFRTPMGRYKYRKLPFGLSVSQDIFQQKIDQILENCPGTVGIADDIACFGATEAEHDANLLNLMDQARKNGLVFNSSKCDIKRSEIAYFGMVFGVNGMKPDEAKVTDLKAMPAPTNKKELQEFLGLITYLSPFIRNLSAHAEPVRKLLCKDTPFEWSEDHQHVFEHLKTLISTEACLKYYDTEAPTYLMVDASERGLGAALLQPDRLQDGSYTAETRPVAFASKSLSPSQKNYVNIEREMLAITFGIKRFHIYLYNRPFVVLSDHKPLEMISGKPLTAAPPRLQAMLLAVQDYDFRVKYTPGKDVGLADALSRLPNPDNVEDIELDVRIEYLQFSDEMIEGIKMSSQADPILNELKEVIYHGWPEAIKELPVAIREFWSYRDQLSVVDGVILKGERVFIPEPHRQGVLNDLHTGHLGIGKTQMRARMDVFWPKINEDIERLCKGCTVCQEHQRSQTHEPLLQTETPARPWSVVGTDLFQYGDDQYLLTADYYTKFLLVDKLPKPATSETVVDILKKYCGMLGLPDVIRSDNGPHYSSQDFKKFEKEYHFKHVTSSPRYPRSNGFIERQVAIAKGVVKKAQQANEDVDLALLRLRTTPLSAKVPSPAVLLFQRRIRDTLPSMIRSTDPMHEDVRAELQDRQAKEKALHDRSARQLPPLIPGQGAMYQNVQTGKWAPAMIRERAPEPRSYVIQTETGQMLRRNRVHLRDRPIQRNKVGDESHVIRASSVPQEMIPPKMPAAPQSPTPGLPPPRVVVAQGPTPGMTGGDAHRVIPIESPRVSSRSGREIRRPPRYSE